MNVKVYMAKSPDNGYAAPGVHLYRDRYFSVTIELDGGEDEHTLLTIPNKVVIAMDAMIALETLGVQPHKAVMTKPEEGVRVNTAYKIKRSEDDNGKVFYAMRWKLRSGEDCKFPATISVPHVVAQLEESLRKAGYDPDQWVGKQSVQLLNIEFASKRGKEIPKAKPEDETKYYTDYLYFKVLEAEPEAA